MPKLYRGDYVLIDRSNLWMIEPVAPYGKVAHTYNPTQPDCMVETEVNGKPSIVRIDVCYLTKADPEKEPEKFI